MRVGRLTVNARLVDHNWPPRWIGPWFGVKLAPKTPDRSSQMVDCHVQLHLVPEEGCNGVQAGAMLYLSRRDGRARIRFGKNWWSPHYGQRPLGWGWWVG